MGWDAYAKRPDGSYVYNKGADIPEFVEASRHLPHRDGMLWEGGLDVSTCGNMLCYALNIPTSVPYLDWSPELTREYYHKADWSFKVPPDIQWAKDSARIFLEVCAKHGYGVHFSY